MTWYIVDMDLMDHEAWKAHLTLLEALPPSEDRDSEIRYAQIWAFPPGETPPPDDAEISPQEAEAAPEAPKGP